MKGFTMGEFTSLEITLLRGEVDENGGDFRTLTVRKEHEGRLYDALYALTTAGYEIQAAIVNGYTFEEDIWPLLKKNGNSIQLVCETFDIFCDEINNVDIVVAFLMEMDPAEVTTWSDHIWFRGSDHEEIVREWTDLFEKRYQEVADGPYSTKFVSVDLPDWLPRNEAFWKEAAENIASQEAASLVGFNGEIYYFA